MLAILAAVVHAPAGATRDLLPGAIAESPSVRPGAHHAVPLYGELVAVYDAPESPYAPGHRGVDVAAPEGALVASSAGGVVSFAGTVAGNRSVTVDHGDGLQTTASFLAEVLVSKGQVVAAGQAVGRVGPGHPAASHGRSHVHLSARRHGVYFDPLELYVGISHADLVALHG